MKGTLLVGFLIMWGCGGNPADTTQRETRQQEGENRPTRPYYTILRKDSVAGLTNFTLLLDSTQLFSSQILTSLAHFKASHCQDTPCKRITLWDNRRAVALWEQRQTTPAWRRKYWPYVCEHNVGEYQALVGELSLYPLLDAEYRRWGGKAKRPINHTFRL